MTAAFDILAAARRLEEAGLNRQQAEAVADTAREAVAAGQPVTQDKLDAAVAELKAFATVRIHAAVDVGVALIVALLRLLPPIGG